MSPAQQPMLSRRTLLQHSGRWAAGGGLAGVLAAVAHASVEATVLPLELVGELPQAQALGTARLRFLGLDIYEARLWAPRSFVSTAYAQSPFALELTYLRSLSGRRIAERSLQEMRRQGSFGTAREAVWLDAMLQTFADVQNGDRFTGLHTPGAGARFWLNGQARAPVRDAEFSRVFFGIWLADASSEPQLRASLLGHAAP